MMATPGGGDDPPKAAKVGALRIGLLEDLIRHYDAAKSKASADPRLAFHEINAAWLEEFGYHGPHVTGNPGAILRRNVRKRSNTSLAPSGTFEHVRKCSNTILVRPGANEHVRKPNVTGLGRSVVPWFPSSSDCSGSYMKVCF